MNVHQRYKLTLSLSLLAASGFSTLVQGQDLIYVPLGTPCELINTLNPAGGGPFSVEGNGGTEARAYRAWSDDTHSLADQGGGDCRHPDATRTPMAIAATITGRSRAGFHSKGNLTAYALNADEPAFTESHLNFWDENITNTTVIPLDDGLLNHFNLRARIFNAPLDESSELKVNVTASVLGYYYSAKALEPPKKPQSLERVVIVAKDNDNGMTDFTDPIAALESINADSDNPYLLDIKPGRYTLSKAMIMKEYVTIQGAGVKETILEGTRGINAADLNSSVVIGASHATLKNLSLLNIGGVGEGGFRIGISNRFSAAPMIDHVNIELRDRANGSDIEHCFGIFNGGTPVDDSVFITHTNIKVNCDVNAYGIYNIGGTHPIIEHVNVEAGGTGNTSDAIHNTGANATIRYSTMKGQRYGVRSINKVTANIAFSTVIGGISTDDNDDAADQTYFCDFLVDGFNSKLDCPGS